MWLEELPNGKFKFFERYKDPYTEKLKKVSITLTSKSNQAKKQAQQLLTEKIKKKMMRTNNLEYTWNQVYNEWWDIYKNTVKSNTLKARIRDQKRIDTCFESNMLINKIDSNFLSDFINSAYYKDNLSKSYVEQLKAHINLVFSYAEERGYISNNPMAKVKIKNKPKTIEQLQKSNNKFLEKDELNEVLSFTRSSNERYANLFEFMSLTGLRIGEALALKFDDIKQDYIEIKSTYNRSLNVHETPKNEYSYRKVETSPRLLELVENQKTIYELFKLTKKGFSDAGYIFFSTSGQPLHVADLNLFLKNTVSPNVNIGTKNLSTHIFRHTHISLLAELGIPLKYIMERVGHNNPKTTLSIYTHVTDGMKQDVKSKISSLSFAP